MPPKKDTGDAGKTTLLKGFEDKETKLLAAASVSSLGPDKYDYDLMAALTGNTAGSLKKMWPSVKKKALDEYPSFAGFLGTTGANITTKSPTKTAPKAAGGRKRKVPVETEPEADGEADIEADSEDVKPKPAPKKAGRKPRAAAAAEPTIESDAEDAKPAPKKAGRKTKAVTTSPDDGETKPTRSSSRKASEDPKSAPAAEVKKKGRPAKKVKKEEVKSEEDSADGGDGLGQYTRREKVKMWLSGTDDRLETIEEEV
ncbi:hypothetical protein SNOG_02290 [Parastagonospora nodorum SN15]|uniref:Uncharacterized protein n=1 Tax=Phaeosphaeria nodorum (strain SN15 / ATCC MYA-4574 / FGSC 10173) TaxID=321614 RepID=Q0V124_PHANO|nr:hypothetical protein SNOG_02290 [Parastagonospora nodorum SN15]EAT90502.1 hypothetical protein SNOG_02290 [Parastagonospora nodorum SN15]